LVLVARVFSEPMGLLSWMVLALEALFSLRLVVVNQHLHKQPS
jgi:hypothetical protein